MKLYTSYYANRKLLNVDNRKVSISRVVPSWFKADGWVGDLAPSSKLLYEYKFGKINKFDYIERYLKEIKNLYSLLLMI